MKKVILLSASMLLLSASAFAGGKLNQKDVDQYLASFGVNITVNVDEIPPIRAMHYTQPTLTFTGVSGQVMSLDTSLCATKATVVWDAAAAALNCTPSSTSAQ